MSGPDFSSCLFFLFICYFISLISMATQSKLYGLMSSQLKEHVELMKTATHSSCQPVPTHVPSAYFELKIQ